MQKMLKSQEMSMFGVCVCVCVYQAIFLVEKIILNNLSKNRKTNF